MQGNWFLSFFFFFFFFLGKFVSVGCVLERNLLGGMGSPSTQLQATESSLTFTTACLLGYCQGVAFNPS